MMSDGDIEYLGNSSLSRRKVKSTEYYDLLNASPDTSTSKIHSTSRKMA